jgi:hypothetical protein
MSPVTIKTKDLAAVLKKRAGFAEADLIKVHIQKGKVTLTPQTELDIEIARSLDDYKKRRTYGPFDSVDEMMDSLEKKVKKGAKKLKRY